MNIDKLSHSAKTLEEANLIISELVALVRAQQEEIEILKGDIEKLQNEGGPHSRNSSKAPSSDTTEQRRKRYCKPRSSRQKGAQPGHKKYERTLLPEDQVDEVKHYYPKGQCACGGRVEIDIEPRYRHQVFDLPKVRYSVTEHQIFSGCCNVCGKQQTAHWPSWVPSGQMEAGLISTIVQLSGQFHLSIRQIQAFLAEQWQLHFSIGAISEAQGKSLPWLSPLYQQIGEEVRKAPVAHADETRHFRGTECRWLWTLVTESLCYFMVHYSRGKAAANALIGDFKGYLVTDHYAAYNDVPAERRQLCWAHLIRHFVQYSERKGKAGEIGKRLLLISHAIIRTHKQAAEKQVIYQRRMQRLRKSFQQTLLQGSQLKIAKKTANQCRHLLKDEAMCWTFLKHPDIPLTNNTAERAIRPYVIWRKLSFASQSSQGDQFRPLILSIIGTAQRLGLRASNLLRRACEEGLHEGRVSLTLPLSNAPPSPT